MLKENTSMNYHNFVRLLREGIGLELDLEEAAELELFGKKTVGNGFAKETLGKSSVFEDALNLPLSEQPIPPMLRDEVHPASQYFV